MWLSAIILGLLGSFHCVGMCGPIVFLLPVDRSNSWKKVTQIFSYHFGRLLAYSSIGLIFGFIGNSFSIFGLQQQLSIAIGVIMIVLAILPAHMMRKFSLVKLLYVIVQKVKTKLGVTLKKKSTNAFLTIGFFNGLLPCGLVYVAVFAAIALGNTFYGSLYLFLFGLGTIPLMTTAIYLGAILSTTVKNRIRKSIPIFIVLFGCLLILRGMGLGIPYVSPKPMIETVDSKYSCH
ncbi:sulfite exporter TauE/SafE family protein [uncultured Algibacter sp.]|uniref:sulfite exporter TauE/SafE family protein n=1 Tax=uncultured Algibacter sp. TaxID=298659 RepID=UPI003217151C